MRAIIINTSRGVVIDNDALYNITQSKKLYNILDVWENEPGVNIDLLNITKIGTAHIAGYSLEGKVNGTKMIYEALCSFMGRPPSWKPELPELKNKEFVLDDSQSDELKLYNLLSSVYNIEKDDRRMRNMIKLNPGRKR